MKSLRYLLLPLVFVLTVCGQNPRHVLDHHPRMMINDTVPDTWEPAKTRLAAITQRLTGRGNAAAMADFENLKKGIAAPNPDFGNSSNEDANLNLLLDYAFAYAVHHKAGDDKTANGFAATIWSWFGTKFTPIYQIVSITTDGNGVATVKLAQPANPPLTPGSYHFSIWGLSNDTLCGPITVLAVPSPTTLTYQTGVKNASFTSPGMLGSVNWMGLDQHALSARTLAQWSYLYDWCYDWLVANGHEKFARDQIKAGYWSSTPTRQSSQFSDQIRESDFHNYAAWPGTAIIEAGLALYGDDPLAETMLKEGVGYLWEGLKVKPAECCDGTYEYNVKKSIDALTGGAMNWEGPTYWRAGTIRFLRAFEAFDSATGRQNNIWNTQFRNTKNAGLFKIYVRDPAGQMANFGDGGNSNSYAGRDNFGMAILNDRFPDPHFVWMMTHSPADWNSGDSGETGLVYKLIFFPYVAGPGSHDPSDLPLAAQFGPDLILRSGWGPNDTFITYTSSLPGVYHRHDDAGSFTMYKHGSLIVGQPYTLFDPAYSNYNRRTIGGNTLTIYDPQDCWKDNAPTCGVDAYKNLIVNDGGQLRTLRRLKNQFPTNEFQISRLWSGSLFTDNAFKDVYGVVDAVSFPVLTSGAGFDYVKHDLTRSYVNKYSGSGDNPHPKVAANGGVIRELIHFHHAPFGTLDPLVVFDRVTATSPAFKKSWLLHTVNPPSVDGTASTPGDKTYRGAKSSQLDNEGGRLFISHLLPENPDVRTVGGNACTPIPILGATNTNPAVFYSPHHGLKPGELVGLATGTQPEGGGGPRWWPNWIIDRYFASHGIATVPDPDHFTLSQGYGADGGDRQPWKTAFLSGNGAPTAKGTFEGQVYYQQDGAGGNTVWQWTGGEWANLVGAHLALPYGYKSPVIYTHSTCNWSYYVDQFGPPGSGGAHLWNGTMDTPPVNVRPNWLETVTPSAHNATDYFLNVLTAAANTVSGGPAVSLLQGTGVWGARIADRSGSYIAVFSTTPEATALQYNAAHDRAAIHVVAGMKAGAYTVTRNGAALPGNYTADQNGSISFQETGGGTIQIALKP